MRYFNEMVNSANYDKYRIDSHKLMYHVKRVSDWLGGKLVCPIYIEISPSSACNYRCLYCGLDFMGHKPKFLDTNILKKRISEMAELGLKSINYSGEGEPFLHKDIDEIIRHTKNAGIDVGITTNGVLFDKNHIGNMLDYAVWVKVSIAGATKETHAKIHRTKLEDFSKVINNMRYAVKIRNKNGYKTTLGMQLLLLPDNWHEAELLAKKAKEIGVDYLVIKPYSQHPLSKAKIYKDIKYADYMHLANKLAKLNDEKFKVIFRIHAMEKWDRKAKDYKHCLALPFGEYVDAEGNVWGCLCYISDKRFYYGNIYENTIEEIWNGELRKKALKFAESELDTSKCRINCRMDEVNGYLWELKYKPPEHVNFI